MVKITISKTTKARKFSTKYPESAFMGTILTRNVNHGGTYHSYKKSKHTVGFIKKSTFC